MLQSLKFLIIGAIILVAGVLFSDILVAAIGLIFFMVAVFKRAEEYDLEGEKTQAVKE